ncbi:hypothetical protein V12B01_13580 [Vibrio splendidus 12B01]|nr:hypothetical protein V12B01_13580 [Vibrio splendidus 12B01]
MSRYYTAGTFFISVALYRSICVCITQKNSAHV